MIAELSCVSQQLSQIQMPHQYLKNLTNTVQYLNRAHKLDKPEKGCILLNHWSQRAVLLTDYDLERGAKGYEMRSQSGSVSFMSWPPLA